MLLSHLLPFLDAEIERLQRARDLLAYVPPSEVFTLQPVEALPPLPIEPPSPQVSDLLLAESTPPSMEAPRVIVLKPYGRSRGRVTKKRPALAAETALRCSVPTGPVFVSAEDVRRAQASKSTQGQRPAPELTPMFEWHDRSSEANSMQALLKKLLDIGSGDESGHPLELRGLSSLVSS